MSIFGETLEVHIHGEVQLLPSVEIAQVWTALESLLQYSNALLEDDQASNLYEFENGIRFDASNHRLQICWTMLCDEEVQQVIEKTCLALNPLSAEGAVLEVTLYDANVQFSAADTQGELMLVYIGPTAQAIAKAQRDSLVQDVLSVMERQFDVSQLTAVFSEIDKLYQEKDLRGNNKVFASDKEVASTGARFLIGEKYSRRLH